MKIATRSKLVVLLLLAMESLAVAQHSELDGSSEAALAPVISTSGNSECCPQPRIWASAEYVHWRTRGDSLPALVTTSVENTDPGQAGRLGLPSTSILFGDQRVSDGSRSGARLSLGGWLNLYDRVGFELTFVTLGNDETSFRAGHGLEIVARPFFNVLDDQQDAKLISFPDLATGHVDIAITSKFYTGEALLRKSAGRTSSYQLDWFLGYRIAGLDDDIRISEGSEVLAGPALGTQFTLTDQFRTRNTFHGVDLGVNYRESFWQCWSAELLARVALGTTRTRTDIVGQTLTQLAGNSSVSNFGLLAQPTNIGTWIDDEFSTVTELGLVLRRQLRGGLSATLGYSYFYWQDVVRAGDQIDFRINTSQLPPGGLSGPARPRVNNTDNSYWAHGFRVGFEYVF